MSIAEVKSAEVSANSQSAWVPTGPCGAVVSVDSVDGAGVSTSWGGASVDLLYSPDGKMASEVQDFNGSLITGKTDGFSVEVTRRGYVAILPSGVTTETIKLLVEDVCG